MLVQLDCPGCGAVSLDCSMLVGLVQLDLCRVSHARYTTRKGRWPKMCIHHPSVQNTARLNSETQMSQT